MIKAIVFDMDGLLFDSERIVQKSWNVTGEQLGVGKVGEHIYHTLGMNVKSRTEYFYKVYGPDFPMEAFHAGTRENFRLIAEQEGVPLKSGAKELLEYGREKGLGMAVATSSRRAYAEDMLAQAGIDGYFDGFVFGDMVKNAKPDPEIYLAACRELGVNPSNALALEDAPNGIRSAYAAGLYPVMIPDLVEPDDEIRRMAYRVLHSLYDVRELLSRCLSQ